MLILISAHRSLISTMIMNIPSSALQYLCLGLLLVALGGVFYHGLYFLLKKYLVRRVCGPLLQRRKDLYSGRNGELCVRSLSDGDVAEISVK